MVSLLGGLRRLGLRLRRGRHGRVSCSLRSAGGGRFVTRLASHLGRLLLSVGPGRARMGGRVHSVVSRLGRVSDGGVLRSFQSSFRDVRRRFCRGLGRRCPAVAVGRVHLYTLLQLNLSAGRVTSVAFGRMQDMRSTHGHLHGGLRVSRARSLRGFLVGFWTVRLLGSSCSAMTPPSPFVRLIAITLRRVSFHVGIGMVSWSVPTQGSLPIIRIALSAFGSP